MGLPERTKAKFSVISTEEELRELANIPADCSIQLPEDMVGGIDGARERASVLVTMASITRSLQTLYDFGATLVNCGCGVHRVSFPPHCDVGLLGVPIHNPIQTSSSGLEFMVYVHRTTKHVVEIAGYV